MKFLLVTVSVIAVFTAECQALRNEPSEAQLLSEESEGQGEAGDIQNLPGQRGHHHHYHHHHQHPVTQLGENQTSSEISDSVAEDQQIKIDDMEILLSRSSWCRSRGGRCGRPNKSTCPSGSRESPKGRPYCSSKNRRCCYPAKCPEDEGFFKVPGSVNQCFKYFTESSRSWHEAQAKCQNESLVLAKPQDPLVLRRYLVETFGNDKAWIGACGTGSSVNWVCDGSKIDSRSSLWWNGTPRDTSSSYCLLLLSTQRNMNAKPTKPYSVHHCSNSSWYALCELV